MPALLYSLDDAKAEAPMPEYPFNYLRDVNAEVLEPVLSDEARVFWFKLVYGEMIDNAHENSPKEEWLSEVALDEDRGVVRVLNVVDGEACEYLPEIHIVPRDPEAVPNCDDGLEVIEKLNEQGCEDGRGLYLIARACIENGFGYDGEPVGDLYEARLTIPREK